jgi:hypothetical protein
MLQVACRQKGGLTMTERKPGHYLGTEVDDRWWRRYKRDGFFARGNGNYWLEEDHLCFLRYLASEQLCIHFDEIENITTGTWHAGRWNLGRPIVKLHWIRDGVQLTSGFVVGSDEDETEAFIIALMKRVNQRKLV